MILNEYLKSLFWQVEMAVGNETPGRIYKKNNEKRKRLQIPLKKLKILLSPSRSAKCRIDCI